MEQNTTRRAALGILATGPIAMLPALAVMQCSTRADAASSRSEWDRALAAYTHARQFSDATPMGHPDEDARVAAYCEAQDILFETPAPSHEALVTKIDLIRDRFQDFVLNDELYGRIIADVRRLGGL